MLADIERAEQGYLARFERHYPHPVSRVWAMLTDNEQLAKWFPELKVNDLRKGGKILFDMQDGTFEEMEIVDLEAPEVLEFTWGEDRVRFELGGEPGGCRLLMIEKIREMTDHTPKDLAGWHVCLDVIGTLLDGKTPGPRDSEWETWYRQYAHLAKERTSQQEPGSRGNRS